MGNETVSKLPLTALDKAFPAAWLLGAGIFIVVALMIFCGWRIFLFEGEAREIARERLLLERDKDEFLHYGSDLPQLVEKHRALSLQTSQFEARQSDLAREVKELEERKESLTFETRDLMGAIKELRAQAEAIGSELGQTRANLEKMRPEGEQTRQQLQTLQAQEKALNESIAQKQKREAALAASVEGLDRQRMHLQELVSRLVEDRQSYADFEKNLNERMGRFDSAIAKVGDLNNSFSGRLEEIEKARINLLHGLEALNLDLHGLASYLDVVKNDRKEWTGVLNDAKSNMQELENQISSLTGHGNRLLGMIEQVEKSDKTFQATLLTEAAAINHMSGEDAKVRAQIEGAAASFMKDGQMLKNITTQLQEASSQIRSLLTNQQGELAAVADAARNIIAQMEKNKQGVDASLKAGATLSHSALALSDQVEEVRTRLKQVDVRSSRMEELLTSQEDRLKMITGLSRQLSAEIDENRRQGMLLQNILTAIDSTLGELKIRPAKPRGLEDENNSRAADD